MPKIKIIVLNANNVINSVKSNIKIIVFKANNIIDYNAQTL